MSFVDFAAARGVILDHPIADGRVHRAPTVNKPRKRNARYRLFPDGAGWVNAYDSDGYDFYLPTELRNRVVSDPGFQQRLHARIRGERDQQAQRWRKRAAEALEIIQRCHFGWHPYLVAKGHAEARGLTDPQAIVIDPDQPDVRVAGCLVVPIRHFRTGELQSVQWISREGRKKFLPGGRVLEGCFAYGPQFAPSWVCEGYATSLSLAAALRSLYRQDRVVACFSAHNLKLVASRLGEQTRIVADHDLPDQRGRQAGIEAAKATGLPWVMPPTPGEDLNDLHVRSGVQAVADLLRAIL